MRKRPNPAGQMAQRSSICRRVQRRAASGSAMAERVGVVGMGCRRVFRCRIIACIPLHPWYVWRKHRNRERNGQTQLRIRQTPERNRQEAKERGEAATESGTPPGKAPDGQTGGSRSSSRLTSSLPDFPRNTPRPAPPKATVAARLPFPAGIAPRHVSPIEGRGSLRTHDPFLATGRGAEFRTKAQDFIRASRGGLPIPRWSR